MHVAMPDSVRDMLGLRVGVTLCTAVSLLEQLVNAMFAYKVVENTCIIVTVLLFWSMAVIDRQRGCNIVGRENGGRTNSAVAHVDDQSESPGNVHTKTSEESCTL
jgi:hypothetical protein